MFQVSFTPSALDDLCWLRKYDQQQITSAINGQLPHEADRETRNRKRLQPNSLAEWELRTGRYRIFYDIDQSAGEVLIVAVGYKQGSKLFVRGREYVL
jgi:mRNA-degrading endonuclease RelE of RelBE toxin-antitoxin system